MSTRIAGIHQPNYLPWLGYFHKIQRSDVFVILDDVDFQQGNSNSVTSRTRIKGANGEILLTVPVKRSEDKSLNKIKIDSAQSWKKKHLKSIQLAYAKAPFFKTLFPVFENSVNKESESLSVYNAGLISEICALLDISTPLLLSSDLNIETEDKNERIIHICQKIGADTYFCGRGGKKYMDENVFRTANVNIIYTNFVQTPYPQLYGEFLPGLSILDVLLNVGKDAVKKMIQ